MDQKLIKRVLTWLNDANEGGETEETIRTLGALSTEAAASDDSDLFDFLVTKGYISRSLVAKNTRAETVECSGIAAEQWILTDKARQLIKGRKAGIRKHLKSQKQVLSLIERAGETEKRIIGKGRPGQVEFRQKLLNIYGNKCMISNCDVLQALEAAHIQPYEDFKNHGAHFPENGLILRCDLHMLFDQLLISFEPEYFQVCIANELVNSRYAREVGQIYIQPHKSLDINRFREQVSKHYDCFTKKNVQTVMAFATK